MGQLWTLSHVPIREEDFCLYQKAIRAPGVGYDGGHAPYVLVPEVRFSVLSTWQLWVESSPSSIVILSAQ